MRRLTATSPRAGAVTAVAAVGLAGAALLAIGLADGEQPVAAIGPAPMVAATSAPPPEEVPPTLPPEGVTLPTPSSDVHVTVPAADLDLPVLPLTPRGGAINPPTLTAAYWIEPYGDPVGAAGESDNTLYLAAHSTGTGEYGFDPLMESDGGGSKLAAGDVVEVSTPRGTVSYTVERTKRYAKGELPGATEVWEASPGRLVLITCFQRGGGRASTENLVVFAES
ncbi:class F sortase [Blastococcus saxobsidens]|uniref:Peptidase C60, sortase A and B n=1 Tax=Blastococcus saxobsidens (strain DD2) TaxID=1146883 RepID=H6RIS5_BLASD|nr:class F sortase [Blastococcus saxobsidens]CCG02269.1 Peptidase C60, sortase A and B [Blastococcus saxobsidens DD2]